MTLEERYAEAERRGHRDGLARGEEEARRAGEKAVAEMRARLGESLARVHGFESTLRREAESSLVRLALEIASRVVRERVQEDDPVAARALGAVLEEAPGREPMAVRLHPDDLESVRSERPELGGPGALRLVPDSTLERGGCLLELESGEVDGRVESQLAAMAERLGTERGP
jgi:flagellar assembly protein FliH